MPRLSAGHDDVSVLGFDMLSAEESGINGPCARPDHCGGAAERRQDDRNPRVTDVAHSDPQFDHGNQRSHDWGPEANEKEYPREGTNNLRNRKSTRLNSSHLGISYAV